MSKVQRELKLIIMEQICKNNYCKKKLQEYRESTSKLYDNIDSLEDDLKERDQFVQKVVKQRNNYQEEISLLKKKNCETHYRGEELLFLEHISS